MYSGGIRSKLDERDTIKDYKKMGREVRLIIRMMEENVKGGRMERSIVRTETF